MSHTDEKFQSAWTSFKLDLQAALFEFVGTTTFFLIGLGGIQAATAASIDAANGDMHMSPVERLIYVSTSMGLALLISAWLFFRITGALFNPNITLAMIMLGILPPLRGAMYCAAQMAGSIAASALIVVLTPGALVVNTTLNEAIGPVRGVFIEALITGVLVLCVLMLAAEKHTTTPFAPVGIGLTLFSCHLWAVYYTGAAMNTARAFGPSVILGFPDKHHWVYWVGPFLGSLLGAGIFTLLKVFDYHKLCPDQASIDPKLSPATPHLFASHGKGDAVLMVQQKDLHELARHLNRMANPVQLTVGDEQVVVPVLASGEYDDEKTMGLKAGDSMV